MTDSHKQLSDELKAAARQHSAAATMAHTLDDEATRLRNAAQLRFVAALVHAGPGLVPMGQAWLSASEHMLDAYAETDAARDQLAGVATSYGQAFYRAEAEAVARMTTNIWTETGANA